MNWTSVVVSRLQVGHKLWQRVGADGRPDIFHKNLIIMKIMDRMQPGTEDFTALLEVPQIGKTVVLAGLACAIGIQRTRVRRVPDVMIRISAVR